MKRGNDDGYTFVEVLAALAILSLSGFIVWSGLSGGIRAVETIQNRNRVTSEIALLEYSFRGEIGKLGPSFWEREYGDEYRGLYEIDGKLILETDSGKLVFPHLRLLEMDQTDRGVTITLSAGNAGDLAIRAAYGTFPLGGGAEDED